MFSHFPCVDNLNMVQSTLHACLKQIKGQGANKNKEYNNCSRNVWQLTVTAKQIHAVARQIDHAYLTLSFKSSTPGGTSTRHKRGGRRRIYIFECDNRAVHNIYIRTDSSSSPRIITSLYDVVVDSIVVKLLRKLLYVLHTKYSQAKEK